VPCPLAPVSRDTGTQGHRDTGTQGHRDTGLGSPFLY